MTQRHNTVKRRSRFAVAMLTVAALSRPAFAVDATVTPTTSAAGIDVTALVNLTAPGSLAGISENSSLIEVLDRRNIPLRTLLSPSTFNLTWDPVFEGIVTSYTSTSPRGVLRLDGVQVGTQGQALSALCINPNCATVAETLVLSASVRDGIARRLLQGVTLRDAARGRIGSRTATLQYTRAFSHAGTDPNDHFATFSSTLTLDPDLSVRLSQFTLVEVSGTSSSPVLALGTPASIPVNLTWNARFEVLGSPPPVTLRSDAVEIRTPGGELIQRIARPLTRPVTRARSLAESFPSSGVVTGTEVISDSLTLPASIAAAARAAGASRVLIRRRFSDGFNTFDADIEMPLGSASLAAFQLTRVDLRFTDGARVRIVDRDAPLAAVADINYLGSGQIQAQWEWAPVSGGGTPLFRPLPPAPPAAVDAAVLSDFEARQTRTLVREFLNNRQRVKLVSPPLPTGESGGILLRLRISAPGVAFELPVVRYFVGSTAAPPVDGADSLAPLTMLEPFSDDDMNRDTRFRWMPVNGARAYRLECYADLMMASGMVTGAVVPEARTQLSPSLLVMDHLADGAGYWCRVVAIGAGGSPTAASDLVRLIARR